MSIRRSKKTENFTVIDNTVFNSYLSFRAIGLLSYLLSKPTDWTVSVSQLVNLSKETKRPEGRDSIYLIIDELIQSGFMIRENKPKIQGRHSGVEYVVFDVPQKLPDQNEEMPENQPLPPKPYTVEAKTDSPLTDLPDTASPLPAEPTLQRTDLLQRIEKDKELSNNPVVPLDYWDEVCPKSGKKNRAEDLRALDWSQWPGLPSVPVMRSYLKVCRTKSPMTQIVLNTFAPHLRQLSSVGISIDVALTEAITCGWQGLKYNWIAKRLDLPVFGQQQQKPQKFESSGLRHEWRARPVSAARGRDRWRIPPD